MNDHPECAVGCPLECVDTCALHPDVRGEPIRLEEALARFEKEAVQRACNTGRYRMPYYTWGNGPPLVLIHGVSDSNRSFVQVIARLSAHFRCVAYDLPSGRGDGALPQHYRPGHLVADLVALLDHLGLQRSYLFASSFGSLVGLAALHQCPARFPRAVVQSGLAWRPLKPAERALAHVMRLFRGPTRRLPWREKMLRKRNFAPFADRAPAVWRYFLETTGWTPIKAFAHQLLLLDHIDLRPVLGEIRQPVLMVCGDCDPVVGRAQEEELFRGLPNVGRVVLEGCGHLPAYTHPEVLAEVTRQSLTPPADAMVTASAAEEEI
jgi:pimeloyl-ACP methyl ester carboxylesterase